MLGITLHNQKSRCCLDKNAVLDLTTDLSFVVCSCIYEKIVVKNNPNYSIGTVTIAQSIRYFVDKIRLEVLSCFSLSAKYVSRHIIICGQNDIGCILSDLTHLTR